MAPKTANTPSREDWHPADIKAALDKAGWTLRSLAAHHGLTSSTTLSHTFLRSYPLNEQRIANAIGVHPKEIWPSRYHPDGRPRMRGIRGMREQRKDSALRSACNGKNGATA